jgi:ubiquinone/menaquinone biosynthesis C-methylase UbiE
MCKKKSNGHVCSPGHSFFLDNFIRRIIQNPKRIVGEYIQKGDTILDLGCGPGYFSIAMAKMAGSTGRVIAVDLQKEMLLKVEAKATKANLSDRILILQCSQDQIGLDPGTKADFILAFYMVHETLDHVVFLEQVKELLNTGGRFLLVEPRFHVSKTQFKDIKNTAFAMGFTYVNEPKKKGGRSLLLSV